MGVANIDELNKYDIVYFFIYPPYLIFNAKTSADQLFIFEEKLVVPGEVGINLVDCYFLIYDETGKNIASEIKSVSSNLIHHVANKIPFQMLQDFNLIKLDPGDVKAISEQRLTQLTQELGV